MTRTATDTSAALLPFRNLAFQVLLVNVSKISALVDLHVFLLAPRLSLVSLKFVFTQCGGISSQSFVIR